jgi:hypothetical protein
MAVGSITAGRSSIHDQAFKETAAAFGPGVDCCDRKKPRRFRNCAATRCTNGKCDLLVRRAKWIGNWVETRRQRRPSQKREVLDFVDFWLLFRSGREDLKTAPTKRAVKHARPAKWRGFRIRRPRLEVTQNHAKRPGVGQ